MERSYWLNRKDLNHKQRLEKSIQAYDSRYDNSTESAIVWGGIILGIAIVICHMIKKYFTK